MPLFVTQSRFTRDYIKGGLAKPEDRHAAIARLCEQAGGKLVSLYFTLGQYDFMVISEMPDAKAASVLAFVATDGGGIEGSVTTQAFTTAEARDMLTAAGKIAGQYKPMGASCRESSRRSSSSYRTRVCRTLADVAPADLDVAVLGQLAPAELPLGDALEPGSLQVVGLDAALGGGPLGQETLEHPPRHTNETAVLADLDPELHRLPFGIPAGVVGKGEEHAASVRAQASFGNVPYTFARKIASGANGLACRRQFRVAPDAAHRVSRTNRNHCGG
ncbi:MAG TPA: GYD domain-containing protein [Stellaceae bacterium]|nr:GYD domain-containing protein [Stellaceae bacterium]